MKNKIFLTSMAIMLALSPALATTGEIPANTTQANCSGDPISFENEERTSGTLTYTAQWDINTYNITYNLDGGTHGSAHPNTYNVESNITISDPSKGGANFGGWTVTTAPDGWGTGSSNSGDSNFKIKPGTYGDIALKAVWSDINCSCTIGTGAASNSCGGTVNTTNNTCDYTWSCANGYYQSSQSATGQAATYTATCTECPAGYDGSDDPRTANTNCYKNCVAITVAHSTSVNPVSSKVYYNGSAYSTCTYNVECEDGYHVVNNGTANPTCEANTIELQWKDGNDTIAGPASCVYGTVNGIRPITQPTKHGYTFTGWLVTDWEE